MPKINFVKNFKIDEWVNKTWTQFFANLTELFIIWRYGSPSLIGQGAG